MAKIGSDGDDKEGRSAMVTYAILLVTTAIIAVLGMMLGDMGDLLLTAPVIVVLLLTIFSERKIHLPTLTVIMIWTSMILSISSRIFFHGNALAILANILMGINLTLIGLIVVFILMGKMPGDSKKRSLIEALVAGSIAMSVFMGMIMLQYYMSFLFSRMSIPTVPIMMDQTRDMLIGVAITIVLYIEFRESSIFKYTLVDFLQNNSGALGLEDQERREIADLIHKGESDSLEFKSTLRTNLATGAVDKRMEKAVLKTLVAFMNTDGGTLLIGVSDDGEVRGTDIESFDNLDKMNLHLTNMIASAIGNDYLPYINFRSLDYEDGKYVIRVDCQKTKKAVFLREGKSEQYYVRSGPSSVELTGMSLVNYINNRYGKNRWLRKPAPAIPMPTDDDAKKEE
ncbi:MAG: putative DNA binding domain-containing protein [Candidatus Methanomethylophilaceae archaeon]|nr:putative DNA binding domain-containing protein [Candidatus Methanomethylophilaceae archaeon]